MRTRAQNQRIFPKWTDEAGGGRLYVREFEGLGGWLARYCLQVNAREVPVRFWQEFFNKQGQRVEIHENAIGPANDANNK